MEDAIYDRDYNKGDNKINIKSENLTKSASGINLETDNRESKTDKTFSAELTMQGKNMLIDVNSNKNAAYGIYEHINSSNSGAVGNITSAEQNKINVNVVNSDKEAVGIWMENTVSDAENTSAQLDLKGNNLTLNAHNSSGINGKISIFEINELKYTFLNTIAHTGKVNKITEVVIETDSRICLTILFSDLNFFLK